MTLARKKPIILHFHGSDIRGKGVPLILRKMANRILLSTPDLKKDCPQGQWLPNPVDTELFKPIPKITRKKKALYFKLSYEKPSEAIIRAKKLGIKVDIIDRAVNYEELPEILSSYEYFLDRYKIESLSKTALEALACGCKVIRWDGKIVTKLPESHKPEKVVEELLKIYSEILGV